MSRVVEPGEYWGQRATRGREMDWENYVDGQTYVLKAGTAEQVDAGEADFAGSANSKRSSFRQWAARQRFLYPNGKPRGAPDRWRMGNVTTTQVHTRVPHGDNTLVIWVEGGIPKGAVLEPRIPGVRSSDGPPGEKRVAQWAAGKAAGRRQRRS